jgi:hypothetical protein
VVSSLPYRFTPGARAPSTHCIGDWVDPTTGLDDMEKLKLTLPGLELQPLGSRYTNYATASHTYYLDAHNPIVCKMEHSLETVMVP